MDFLGLIATFMVWIMSLILTRKQIDKILYIDSLEYIANAPNSAYGLLPYRDPTDAVCNEQFDCKQLGSNLVWALKAKNASYIDDYFELTFDKCNFDRNDFVDMFYPGFAAYHSNCPADRDENDYVITDFA
jgi:hypothetical protein